MSWWQKKVLKYALSRTDFLDNSTIDLDNLDVALGRQNVLQFKNVGLNIQRISRLLQLPPSLRIETARVLSLRLTVPADLYQSSIVAEVDGVEVSLKLEEQRDVSPRRRVQRARSPITTRNPQHRKVQRRIHSPPPYDPGGLDDSDERLPTTQEMAKSFLMEEPVRERRHLEASFAAQAEGLDESIASSSGSEPSEYGTGATSSAPGFLAGFLQGIIDRLQLKVKNVEAKLEMELPGDTVDTIPVIFTFRIADIGVARADATNVAAEHAGQRRLEMDGISLNLMCDAAIFSELSELPSRSSPAASRHPTSSMAGQTTVSSGGQSEGRGGTFSPSARSGSPESDTGHPVPSQDGLQTSMLSAEPDRFADAEDESFRPSLPVDDSDLDIQPGDDNISWGSRRNKSKAPTKDLWNSMASEDDLPDSLLLDRASTPRVPSARSDSPSMTRSRRNVSPCSRQLPSPGSWPQMEEGHERGGLQPSPGSWPAYEHGQHGMFASLDAQASSIRQTQSVESAEEGDQAAAMLGSTTQSAQQVQPVEDLTASRIYSHEEAESMFMSAMSHRPMHVPGGWGSDTASQASQPQPSQDVESTQVAGKQQEDDGLAYGALPQESDVANSGQQTPRASSPATDRPTSSEKRSARAEKQIIAISNVVIWVPSSSEPPAQDTSTGRQGSRTVSDSFAPVGVPGTFSAYSEMSASRKQKSASFLHEGSGASAVLDVATSPSHLPTSEARPGVDVEIFSIRCQFDVPCIRLLYRAIMHVAAALPSEPAVPPKKRSDTRSPPETPIRKITIVNAAFALMTSIGGRVQLSVTDHLLALRLANVDALSSSGDLDVRMGTFEMTLGGYPLLMFDKSHETTSSIVISDDTPDLGFKISNRTTTTKRPVKDIVLQTVLLDLTLDLVAFDDAFSSYGGLSGVLEAGNSILSDSGLTSTPPSPKVTKGVRFEGETMRTNPGPEIKFSGRIGGVSASLEGESCIVVLRTNTMKTLYREAGMAVTFEHAVVAGPHRRGEQHTPSIVIDLSTARIEYLMSPQEKDLDRLLSLLTPSQDKYDGQDEILVDTLLRQRRKGAVARVSIADIKVKVDTWTDLTMLDDLGKELSKLSAVAKYLPEDERPGLLSLVRIKSSELRLPVNDGFGKVHVNLEDIHCAHVGLPALFALSVGALKASRNGNEQIVHSLLPTEHLPMIMVRTLGDEVEPLVKVKLYNLCVEYSVPVLLAATGLDEQAATEEMVAELANSVASLALREKESSPQRSSATSDRASSPQKKTNIEVLVHESAVGLQPKDLASKGMLVLSDALLTTAIPPERTVTAQLQLRKAAIFIADEVQPDTSEESLPPRGVPSNTATGAKLTSALSKRGFVSVGSIMSAQINVKAIEAASSGGKPVEIDVRNELLLLETCADSTQTLIAVLNGLAPPSPPSKQAKYLTEPMTIEDMMASFSGEPQVKEERPPSTLFDADDEPDEDDEGLLGMAGFDEEVDDILAESEMEASLYGPISGILGGDDKSEDGDEADDTPETVQSLLEDDPFEMPDMPDDGRMSDATLMRELQKQCKTANSDHTVDLGNYEIEDLGFDALGSGGQQPLGTRHRFSTPAARQKTLKARPSAEMPFKLRLRDLHIIWNIYDGYDWKRTREGITQAVEQVEHKAEERNAKRRQSYNDREDEEPVIGDFLFNSIYIGVPSNHDAQELRRQINKGIDELASETESVPVSGMSRPTTAYSASGRPLNRQRQRRRLKLERSRAHKVAFELKGVCADILVFPPDDPEAVSSIDIRARDFEIFDNVPTSTWRKFLTHLESDPSAREMLKPMMHIEMLNVKTHEQVAASEIAMHVSVLPVRLHVDQDALDFITRFFEFKDESMTRSASPSDQPFLQRVEVDTVDMCLDYKPKRVDYGGIRSGHYTEFKNFVILDGANIKLRHAIIYGIRGFEPLHQTLNDVWMPDIKRNQLPTVLAGLAPVRSLVNIGSGVRDVVAIPVREYKKDGRIVRSIQKGAMQFGKTTTSELARLGAKVAMGTQTFLTGAEGMLSPASASPRAGSGLERDATSPSDDDSTEKRAISAYANQPLGVFSGLRSARRQLESDLLTAKDALIAVQGEMLESATPGSAAAAVARHAPTVILRPVIGASRAVGTALLGVGNQIDRGNVRKAEDKYKRR